MIISSYCIFGTGTVLSLRPPCDCPPNSIILSCCSSTTVPGKCASECLTLPEAMYSLLHWPGFLRAAFQVEALLTQWVVLPFLSPFLSVRSALLYVNLAHLLLFQLRFILPRHIFPLITRSSTNSGLASAYRRRQAVPKGGFQNENKSHSVSLTLMIVSYKGSSATTGYLWWTREYRDWMRILLVWWIIHFQLFFT